jgi:hypothetical protein
MKLETDILGRIVQKLDASGIAYMIVGSVASSFYGQYRASHDFDIVIAPTKEQFTYFLTLFGDGYYLNQETAWESFRTKFMFNVIDETTGMKVDLMFLKNFPFDKTAFERRNTADIFEVSTVVARAEDTILNKLVWSKSSESLQQRRDVLNVISTQKNRLDWEYLRRWAKLLGVEETLEKILLEAEKIG